MRQVGEVENHCGILDMAILSQKNMLVIRENQGESLLCLIIAPRLLLSTKEYTKVAHTPSAFNLVHCGTSESVSVNHNFIILL